VNRKTRNVTITLDEELARWARVAAARQDISVSRMVADLLNQRRDEQHGYQKAMRRALERSPFLHTGGVYLSREDAHERTNVP
jgi:hypothetical protein